MELIEYPKCSTCKKAKKWLEEQGFVFTERDITKETPTVDEIKKYLEMSKYPVKKFFNTSGILYKEYDLKKKLDFMTEEEKITLLSEHGMLIKRPILVMENMILVGFKQNEWEEKLKNN